jgi:hypothetical protein
MAGAVLSLIGYALLLGVSRLGDHATALLAPLLILLGIALMACPAFRKRQGETRSKDSQAQH